MTVSTGIRLDDDLYVRLCKEADARRLKLSPYIRLRLFEAEDVAGQIAALRREIGVNSSQSGGLNTVNMGILVEILLLLRAVVKEEDRAMVRGEVTRLGLPYWTRENQHDGD